MTTTETTEETIIIGKCEVCQAETSRQCSSCKSTFYCSEEHQKKDWENHKIICNITPFEVHFSLKKSFNFLMSLISDCGNIRRQKILKSPQRFGARRSYSYGNTCGFRSENFENIRGVIPMCWMLQVRTYLQS